MAALVDYSPFYRFRSKRFGEDAKSIQQYFEQYLKTQDKNTQVLPVRKASELLLGKGAKLQGSFRLTNLALSQICKRLAPGLSPTLRVIAGDYTEAAAEHRSVAGLCSLDLAIRVFNDIVRLRYPKLANYRLVLDRGDMRVVGLVGPKYQYYSNWEVYCDGLSFVDAALYQPVFFEAASFGRRVAMCFRETVPLVTAEESPELGTCYRGVYFGNSETQDCCIKGSAAIIFESLYGKAVLPVVDSCKVVHIHGPKFKTKRQSMWESLKGQLKRLEKLPSKFSAAREERLCDFSTSAEFSSQVSLLTRSLRHAGVKVKLAEAVIANTFASGSKAAEAADTVAWHMSRTVFDLAETMIKMAPKQSLGVQEYLEQSAMKFLLAGTIKGE